MSAPLRRLRKGSLRVLGAQLSDQRAAAEGTLEATLHEIASDGGDVEIERLLVEGEPAAVLVEESRGPDRSWQARGGTAGSPNCCWGRRESSSPTMRSAPWESCGRDWAFTRP
jgi:hypothetical protein